MVRKIQAKTVLELHAEGLSGRAIATSQGMSRHSVAAVLEAANRLGVTIDDLRERSDAEVYALLFPGRGEHHSVFAQPDWKDIHRELARVGVTLKLLHSEYADTCRASGTVAMSYDRFCKTYQRYVLTTGASSRVGHKAGVSIEVDWSGPTMKLLDPITGKTTKVFLFVACLPFSRYAFVYPVTDMTQESWLRAHVAMFEFFGGSAPRLVPDNLKTGVTSRPKDGEIVLNSAYRELAAHYSAAVLPGRVRRPKDKASVENTVGHVATWVIAAMRDQTFSTLAELRHAIHARIEAYNQQPFQKRSGSRTSVFEHEEKPLLRPLPAVPYEISTWVYGRKVQKNSYVAWRRNFYSVPFAYIGHSVDLRITESMLQVYQGSERISSHQRVAAGKINEYQTNPADLPEGRTWRQWDRERITAWAQRIGSSCVLVIDRIFESVPIDEQGLNAALAVVRLAHRYSPARLEAACRLAVQGPVYSPRYAHIQPILETGQDRVKTPPGLKDEAGGYVRGADYYAGDMK